MSIDWASFTPATSLGGGILIGIAASCLVLFNGRIAGISGIVAGLLRPQRDEWNWRLAFVLGLLLAPVIWLQFSPLPEAKLEAQGFQLVAAGLLVGLGTRLGAGCTSGHGVCGLARGSRRSAVATGSFMAAGFITVYVIRHLLGA